MQNEIDITKLRLSHQEDKCRSLETRCGLLERTVKLLTIPKIERWQYDLPEIPSNYWTPENGFHGEYYAGEMERFLIMIEECTCALMNGGYAAHNIDLGDRNWGNVLIEDEILLPHWKEFADALQLSTCSDAPIVFSISNIQLAPEMWIC